MTTDTLVEDDHFNLKWFKPEQIGTKAIESNVSDIAAMGGFPSYALTSIVIPKNTSVDFIDRLYTGINNAAKKFRVSIMGVNVASGKKISITMRSVGLVEKKNLCLISSAKINE